jgi:predicted nucleotidyltransferase component of viral defense system
MHTESLTSAAGKLFPTLSSFKDDFYLAGGTALALQIGHRVSVDFDMFSDMPIKKTLLKKVEELYRGSSREFLVSNKDELTLMIDGVKFTFLYYPFPAVLPLETKAPVPLLSIKEILAAKAYTIGRRGQFKDYVDIYTGLTGGYSTLGDMIALASKKYGDAFNDRLFLEQLVYMDDIEETAITVISGKVPTKEDLIQFFTKLVKEESGTM